MSDSGPKLLALILAVLVVGPVIAVPGSVGMAAAANAAGNTNWGSFQSGTLNAGAGNVPASVDYSGIATGWSASGTTDVASGPAVVNGTVYAADGDAVRALAASDGSVRWETTVGGRVFGTPAVTNRTARPDEVVYVATDAGTITALDDGDGSVIEGFPVTHGAQGDDIGSIVGSPTVGPDGTVYVATEAGMLHAIDESGTPQWVYDLGAGAGTSTPAVHDGAVYVGDRNGTLHAVAADDGSAIATADVADGALNTPSVDNATGTVVVTATDGTVAAYASNLTGQAWADTGTYAGIYSSAALAGDSVIVGSAAGLVGEHSLADGSTRWTTTVETKNTFGASVTTTSGTVFVGTDDGSVVVLNGSDGSEQTSATVGSETLVTAPTVVGSAVYVGTSNGTVQQFVDADPSFEVTGVDVPSSATVGETVTVNATVANDGRTGGIYEATLTANGTAVATQDVSIDANGQHQVTLQYTPSSAGETTLSVGSQSGVTEVLDAAPDFSVTAIDAPAQALDDETITVTATVDNTNRAAGTYRATLAANGTTVATQDVSIDANGQRHVSFQYTPDSPGDTTLSVGSQSTTVTFLDAAPVFEVTGIDAPGEVTENETITVTATVANDGRSTGTYEATLAANGTTVATQEVSIDAGSQAQVSFQYTPDSTGETTLSVGSRSTVTEVLDAAPDFSVTAIDAPGEATADETITVTATVDNTNRVAGTYRATLTANGTAVATQDVSIDANGQRHVSFQYTPDSPGDTTLSVGSQSTIVSVQASDGSTSPSFEVTGIDAPTQALDDETITVTATVENDGSAAGTYQATLTANGTTVATQDITLGAGGQTQVSFQYTPDSTGETTLSVGSRSATVAIEAQSDDDTESDDSSAGCCYSPDDDSGDDSSQSGQSTVTETTPAETETRTDTGTETETPSGPDGDTETSTPADVTDTETTTSGGESTETPAGNTDEGAQRTTAAEAETPTPDEAETPTPAPVTTRAETAADPGTTTGSGPGFGITGTLLVLIAVALAARRRRP